MSGTLRLDSHRANPEKILHYLYGRLQGTSRFVRLQLRSAVKTFVFSSSILLHLGIFFPIAQGRPLVMSVNMAL